MNFKLIDCSWWRWNCWRWKLCSFETKTDCNSSATEHNDGDNNLTGYDNGPDDHINAADTVNDAHSEQVFIDGNDSDNDHDISTASDDKCIHCNDSKLEIIQLFFKMKMLWIQLWLKMCMKKLIIKNNTVSTVPDDKDAGFDDDACYGNELF